MKESNTQQSFKSLLRPLIAAVISAAAVSFPVQADEPFRPEVMSVEQHIAPGANVFLNQAGWDGASRIHVYGQDDLKYKGSMPAGLTAQVVISKDGKTAYVLSDFLKRMVYGPTESVVAVYDVATLSRKTEIIVPNKAVKALAMHNLLELSADESLLYVQNATPATSVTVVDLATGSVLQEIPTPGCYGVYPALKGTRFTTVCGTGQLKTISVTGKEYSVSASDKIFDADTDPLYVPALRRKSGELVMTTFGGALYLIDDSGKTAKLKDKLQINAGVEGNWAPGGSVTTAYNAELDTAFVLMHPDAYDGSHKNASAEIWAYSLKGKKLLSRSEAAGLIAVGVSQGKNPVLFGANEEEETVERFAASDAKSFVFSKTGSDAKAGWVTQVETGL